MSSTALAIVLFLLLALDSAALFTAAWAQARQLHVFFFQPMSAHDPAATSWLTCGALFSGGGSTFFLAAASTPSLRDTLWTSRGLSLSAEVFFAAHASLFAVVGACLHVAPIPSTLPIFGLVVPPSAKASRTVRRGLAATTAMCTLAAFVLPTGRGFELLATVQAVGKL